MSKTPKHLLDKYGESEMLALVEAVKHKRGEAEYRGYLRDARPVFSPPPSPSSRSAELGHKIEALKIWPHILLAAKQSGLGGAIRLWAFAKNLDDEGRGALPASTLERYCASLDVKPRTYKRWLELATNSKLIKPVRRKTGEIWFVLAGRKVACELVNCEHVGPRYALVSPNKLAKKGWISIVWAALLATYPPIMARATLRALTGASESSQRLYERDAGVVATPNYAVSHKGIDHLSGEREFGRKHAFAFRERSGGKYKIAWRLPDQRDASVSAERGRKGRSRKINSALNSSSLVGRAQSEVHRVFHETPKATKASMRKLARSEFLPWVITELYQRRFDGPNAKFYTQVPT